MKFFRNERGSILIMTALLLPVLLGFVGIAFDIGRLYVEKAKMQNMVDAAVLAALTEFKKLDGYKPNSGKLLVALPVGALEDEIEAAFLDPADTLANEYLLKNSGDAFFQIGNGGARSKLYALGKHNMASYGNFTYCYEIIVEKSFPLSFARIVFSDDVPVRAGAVCTFTISVPEPHINYAYALENWSRLSLEDLSKIDPALRLQADREAMTNLARFFMDKDATFLNATIGTDSPGSQTLFGWYEKETMLNGNINVKYTPYNNSVPGKTSGEKVMSWLQGDYDGVGDYDSTRRYLFSEYAVSHQNGIKITIKSTNGKVTFVRVQVNPADSSNGSKALEVSLP